MRLAALMLAAALTAHAGDPFAALERRSGGRLGVVAVDTGTGRTLSHRGGERFTLCSTFKLLLAAYLLHEADAGRASLARVLPYGPADLLTYSPVTRARVAEGGMTMEALAEAAVETSDNTAANLLLAALGGPPALTRYARALGDPVTRLDRNEPALNTPVPGQDLDTTTPEAMAATVRKVVLGDALAPASRARLGKWLAACATGKARLRAGLPPAWKIEDKTGTGDLGATNDLGVLFPPGRAPIVVAAYYGSGASFAAREAVLAEVGRIVAAELGR